MRPSISLSSSPSMSDAAVAPVSDTRGPSETPSPLTDSPSLKRKAAGYDASEADDRVEKTPRYGTDDESCSTTSPHSSRPSATPRSSCAPADTSSELHDILSVRYHQEHESQEDESDEEVWYPGPPTLMLPLPSSASEFKSEITKGLELKDESSSHFQSSTRWDVIVPDMKGKQPVQSAPMSSYCYPWQSGNSTSVDEWIPGLAPAVLDKLQSFVRMLALPGKRDTGCSFLLVDNVGPSHSHVDALPAWPRRGSYGGSCGLYDNVLPIARDECECTICVRALAQRLEQSESLSPPPKLECVSPPYPLFSETTWSASSKPHDLLVIGVPMPSVESSAHADEKSQSVPRCSASPTPVAGPSSQRRGGTRYGSAASASVRFVLDNVAVAPLPPLQDVVEHHAQQMRVE
ncbi:hypothetical protein C8Q74DRAFT_79997 [Fomes fomentarius]|nr:hypothetical protein C8Q74DRAFT_79997 [Fomes fomentarius]